MPTSEVGFLTKLLEVGKDVGTPIGIIFIMIIMWQFLNVFKELVKFAIDAGKKFLDRHFQHIDSLEKELQEIVKVSNANSEKLSQTLSTVNSSITALSAHTTQNVQEIKPIGAVLAEVKQVIKHCENNSKGRD